MKRFISLLNIVLALSLVVAVFRPAPSTSTPTPAPTLPNEGVIKIGFAGNLSDPGTISIMKAVEMAISDANNVGGVIFGDAHYMFKLITADDFGRPEGAVQAAQRLVDSGVVGVVGHIGSVTSISASEIIYGRAEVVQVSPFAMDPAYTLKGLDTSYRVSPNSTSSVPVTARMTFDLGAERIVIVHTEHKWMRDLATEFETTFKEVGGEVTGVFNIRSFDIPFHIEAKEPGIIMFTGPPEDAGFLVLQLKKYELDIPIIGFDWLVGQTFLEVAGSAAEGSYAWFPGKSTALMPAFEVFADKYLASGFAKEPREINPFAPYAYDATGIIIEAVVLAGSAEREDVAAAMKKINAYPGYTGEITFDEYGDMIDQDYRLYKVVDGEWVDWLAHEWVIVEEPIASNGSDPTSSIHDHPAGNQNKAIGVISENLSWDSELSGLANGAAELIFTQIAKGKPSGTKVQVKKVLPATFWQPKSEIPVYYITIKTHYKQKRLPHNPIFSEQTLKDRYPNARKREKRRNEQSPYNFYVVKYTTSIASLRTTEVGASANISVPFAGLGLAFVTKNTIGQSLAQSYEWWGWYRHVFTMSVELWVYKIQGEINHRINPFVLGEAEVDDEDEDWRDIVFP